MVKSVSEYSFDVLTNYVRTREKSIDLDEMLSYLKRHSNTVKDPLATNNNKDELVFLVLKTKQYKNSKVDNGIIVKKGKIVKNISSAVIQNYNIILKKLGALPAMYNTKYMVLQHGLYDKYEGKSLVRMLNVFVSKVNIDGKSRALVAFCPEPLQSADDIVNNAVQEKTELLKNNEY